MEISNVPLNTIQPSPFQRRRHFDVAGLAETIKNQGLLEPIIVRPVNGHSELVDGDRRVRAYRLNGEEVIPAIVRDMTDTEAALAVVTANNQREDITPLEEAGGVQALVEIGMSYEDISAQLGRSPKWVARRASLMRLSPKWLAAIDDPTKRVCDWPVACLELIARHEPATQDGIFKALGYELGNVITPNTLRDRSRRFLCELKGAPFKEADDTLPGGSCTGCTKRSDACPLLFDDDDFRAYSEAKPKAGARCLDPACFEAKIVAVVKARLEKAGPDAIAVKCGYKETPEFKNAVQEWSIKGAKKGDRGAVPCVRVDGEKVGTMFWGIPPKPEKAQSPGAQQQAKADSIATAIKAERENKVSELLAATLDDWLANPGNFGQISYPAKLAFIGEVGIDVVYSRDIDWKEINKASGVYAQTDDLFKKALSSWLEDTIDFDDVAPACRFFGLEYAEFERQAEEWLEYELATLRAELATARAELEVAKGEIARYKDTFHTLVESDPCEARECGGCQDDTVPLCDAFLADVVATLEATKRDRDEAEAQMEAARRERDEAKTELANVVRNTDYRNQLTTLRERLPGLCERIFSRGWKLGGEHRVEAELSDTPEWAELQRLLNPQQATGQGKDDNDAS